VWAVCFRVFLGEVCYTYAFGSSACLFYSDNGHFSTGVFIFNCDLCRLENVMCVLYFHEFNENLASGPIYLYHSDCGFCRPQNIVDPVMNFKSRYPGALMVKATYQCFFFLPCVLPLSIGRITVYKPIW
jgi:hypothetical protein